MESLRASEDVLRPAAPAEDVQQVLAERDRLKARVESLAIEIADARVAVGEVGWLKQQCHDYHSQVENLKSERDELDLQNDELLMAAQVLTDERHKLDERVSDLLLEIENLKDENAVLKQTASDVGPIEPQFAEGLLASEFARNQLPLAEIRDRVLGGLKLGKQSATYKAIRAALDQFVRDAEEFSATNAVKCYVQFGDVGNCP